MQIMALREQPVLKPVNFYGTPGGPLYYPLRPVVLLGTVCVLTFVYCQYDTFQAMTSVSLHTRAADL